MSKAGIFVRNSKKPQMLGMKRLAEIKPKKVILSLIEQGSPKSIKR